MRVMKSCSRGIQLYELWTGLYMLEPWEKIAFSEFRREARVLPARRTDRRLLTSQTRLF